MGGAAAALDKTNWSPLAGKNVIVWPDHDEPGDKCANAVIPKWLGIGIRVRRIHLPEGKRPKWDAADAVAEGIDRVPARGAADGEKEPGAGSPAQVAQ